MAPEPGEDGLFEGAYWPSYDEAKAAENTVTIAVQVNGKLRSSIEVQKGALEEEVVAAARAEDNVKRHLDGAQERRVIYVKERLVNFVVG